MIGGRRSFLPEILGQTDRVGAKSTIFNRYSLSSASAVTLSEKSSINSNRKLHYALSNERNMNAIRCP